MPPLEMARVRLAVSGPPGHGQVADRPLVVDEQTAAALLSCSRRTVRRLVQRGALPRVFITRRPAYRLSDLEAFVDQAAVNLPTGAPQPSGAAVPVVSSRRRSNGAAAGPGLPSTWPRRTPIQAPSGNSVRHHGTSSAPRAR